jgi:hypothetical protein
MLSRHVEPWVEIVHSRKVTPPPNHPTKLKVGPLGVKHIEPKEH